MQVKAITQLFLLVMVTTNTYLAEGQLEKLCTGIQRVDEESSATLECNEKGFNVEISLSWITPKDIKGIRIDLFCNNNTIITVQDFYELSSKQETFTSSFDTSTGSISSCVLKVCYLTTRLVGGLKYEIKPSPNCTLPKPSLPAADNTIQSHTSANVLKSAPVTTNSILSADTESALILKPLQTIALGLKSVLPVTLSPVSSSVSILSSGSAESAVINPLQMVSSISSYVLPSPMMSTSADVVNSVAAFPLSFFDSINYIVPRQSPIAANGATLSSDYFSPLYVITTQARETQTTTTTTTLLTFIPSAYPTFLPDKSTDNLIIPDPSTSHIEMNRSKTNARSSEMNTQPSNDAFNLPSTVAGDNQTMLITVLVTVLIFIVVIFMALVSCSVHLLMKHYKIVHKKGNSIESLEAFTFHIEKDEKDLLSALACSPSLVTIVSPLNEIESPHHCSENSLTTDTGTNDDSDSANAMPVHCASSFSVADVSNNTKLEHEELCSQPSLFSETIKSVCEPETFDIPPQGTSRGDDDTCDEVFHPNTEQLMMAAGVCRMAIDAKEIGTYAKLKLYHDPKAYLHCYNSFVDDTNTIS